jgi:hypothetical protein
VLDVGVDLLFAEGVKAMAIADVEKGAFGMCHHVFNRLARKGADDVSDPYRYTRDNHEP